MLFRRMYTIYCLLPDVERIDFASEADDSFSIEDKNFLSGFTSILRRNGCKDSSRSQGTKISSIIIFITWTIMCLYSIGKFEFANKCKKKKILHVRVSWRWLHKDMYVFWNMTSCNLLEVSTFQEYTSTTPQTAAIFKEKVGASQPYLCLSVFCVWFALLYSWFLPCFTKPVPYHALTLCKTIYHSLLVFNGFQSPLMIMTLSQVHFHLALWGRELAIIHAF
jgi:hypothetical protein